MSVVFLSVLTSIRSIRRWIARLSGASRIACSHLMMASEVYSSGGSVFSKDIPPFMICEGRNGSPSAVNRVGMRRNGFSMSDINAMCDVLKIFTRGGLSVPNALQKIREEVEPCKPVEMFIEFCESSKRGVVSGMAMGRHSAY